MAKKSILGRNLQSLFSDEEENTSNGRGLELLINPSTSLNADKQSEKEQQESIKDKVVIWEDVLERIKKKSNPQVFFWFAPLRLVSQTEKTLTLKAKTNFDKDWINNHYLDFIGDIIREVYDLDLEIKVTAESATSNLTEVRAQNTAEQQPRAKKEVNKERLFSGFLNPNYTFDKFIVGSSNQFAHAASTAVARKPGEAYNPLFIYGGVGLGKTHLINAIGNHIVKGTPKMARVCCISAESFTNQVINSIKSNKMEEFRNRYRFGCDVLLIDDIQFIAGKESTQEEFFHTFNTLYESKKQIVLTSDKSPKDMSYLEERLRSRFEWGLITDIQPPETETRIAIVKKKAESEGISLPNEVAVFLAQNTKSNIRELEGTLTNIIAYAELLDTDISIDLAKEVLKNILKDQDRKVLSIEAIQKEVASFFGIKTQDMKSARKHKHISFPRQIAMYLARKYTGASYPEIGEKFGGKDHSTVIYAVKKIEKITDKNIKHKNTVDRVARKIEEIRSG